MHFDWYCVFKCLFKANHRVKINKIGSTSVSYLRFAEHIMIELFLLHFNSKTDNEVRKMQNFRLFNAENKPWNHLGRPRGKNIIELDYSLPYDNDW